MSVSAEGPMRLIPEYAQVTLVRNRKLWLLAEQVRGGVKKV